MIRRIFHNYAFTYCHYYGNSWRGKYRVREEFECRKKCFACEMKKYTTLVVYGRRSARCMYINTETF